MDEGERKREAEREGTGGIVGEDWRGIVRRLEAGI